MKNNNFFNDHIGPLAIGAGAATLHQAVASRNDKREAKVQLAKNYVLSKKMTIPRFVAETYNDERNDMGAVLEELSEVIPPNTFQHSEHYKDFNKNYKFVTKKHFFGQDDLYIIEREPNNEKNLPLKDKVIKRSYSSGSALASLRGGGSSENDPYFEQLKDDIHSNVNEFRPMTPEEIEKAYDNSNFNKIRDTVIVSGQSLGLILLTAIMFNIGNIMTRKIINITTPYIPKKIRTLFSTEEENSKNPSNTIQEILTTQLNFSKNIQEILTQQSNLLNKQEKQNNHKLILETITNYNENKLNKTQAYVILRTICEIPETDIEIILKKTNKPLFSTPDN